MVPVCVCVLARSGRTLFSGDSDKCHCYVEALLEPPRRPVAASPSAASAQRRTNSTSVAGSLIHGIASRLRARSNVKTVKYKDNDDEEDTDIAENDEVSDYAENDLTPLDNEADFGVYSDGRNRGNSVAQRNSFCSTSGLDFLNHTMTGASLAPADMDNVIIDDDTAESDRSSTNNDADDVEWNPKKPFHRRRVKRGRPPVCLSLKLKTDPALDGELNAIRNDSTGCDDIPTSCEPETAVISEVGHRKSLAPKSLSKKLKHVSHKKSRLHTDAKNGIRGVRSKDGPKWEKKVSIFVLRYHLITQCIAFWPFLNLITYYKPIHFCHILFKVICIYWSCSAVTLV